MIRSLVAVALAGACLVTGIATREPVRAAGGPANITLEVLVESDASGAAIEAIARANDGIVLGNAPGVVLVGVPESTGNVFVDEVTRTGAVVREPAPVDVRPEGLVAPEQFGPTTTNADSLLGALAWHAAGYTGKGVRIGIIDYFDVTRYWNTAEHGPKPIAGVTARCFAMGASCTSDFFDGANLGGEDHGVAVVEVIRDVAPDAQLFIGQATTLSDYRALIDWFVSKDVHIINRSLGSRYDGPGDGRGPLDDIAAEATRRGMIWVNSGGNNGAARYYRGGVRLSGNRVAFGPTGNDTFLEFRGCVQLAGVRWATDWDKPPSARSNYDAYLWDSPRGNPGGGTIVDSSTLDQRSGAPPLEYLGESRCPTPGNSLFLEVRHVSGDTSDVLEVSDYGSGIAEYAQTKYSASVPIVDSDDPGVLAVGSIDPPGGTAIADYSSQGPTNDGRIAPDVTAVSRFPTQVFGTFAGTSASAAAVSGAAALMLDADLATRGHPLAAVVRHAAVDRGATGPDNVFGHGQFTLPPPPDGNSIDQLPATLVPLDVPRRVLDTRTKQAIGPPRLIGDVWHGEILDLPVVSEAGLPSGQVSAVAINVTSIGPDRASYVQVMPTDAAEVGGFSNLNVDLAGQTRANFAVVPVGADGNISIYSTANGNIVVDLLGWFTATPNAASAGRFVELPRAQRVLDSRSDTVAGPIRSGEVRSVPMPKGIDPDLVDALVVNVTATRVTRGGWIQAMPTGVSGAAGATSTLNVAPGDMIANAAIVSIGPKGVALTSYFQAGGHADVIVDVIGYVTSGAAPSAKAGRYVSVRPDRAFDSRRQGGALHDQEQLVIDARQVGVNVDASAVVWNVTAVGTTRPGYATGWAADAPKPPTSLLNWSGPKQVRAAGSVTAVDAGRARFAVSDGRSPDPAALTHLVVDVFGYFT